MGQILSRPMCWPPIPSPALPWKNHRFAGSRQSFGAVRTVPHSVSNRDKAGSQAWCVCIVHENLAVEAVNFVSCASKRPGVTDNAPAPAGSLPSCMARARFVKFTAKPIISFRVGLEVHHSVLTSNRKHNLHSFGSMCEQRSPRS